MYSSEDRSLPDGDRSNNKVIVTDTRNAVNKFKLFYENWRAEIVFDCHLNLEAFFY